MCRRWRVVATRTLLGVRASAGSSGVAARYADTGYHRGAATERLQGWRRFARPAVAFGTPGRSRTPGVFPDAPGANRPQPSPGVQESIAQPGLLPELRPAGPRGRGFPHDLLESTIEKVHLVGSVAAVVGCSQSAQARLGAGQDESLKRDAPGTGTHLGPGSAELLAAARSASLSLHHYDDEVVDVVGDELCDDAHAVHGGASLEMVADDEPIAFQLAFPTSPG